MPTEDAWGFDNDIAYLGGCDFFHWRNLARTSQTEILWLKYA